MGADRTWREWGGREAPGFQLIRRCRQWCWAECTHLRVSACVSPAWGVGAGANLTPSEQPRGTEVRARLQLPSWAPLLVCQETQMY